MPAFMTQFLQQMANAPMFQQPQPPRRHITFKTLKDNGAEEFLGDRVAEPQVALDWIEQVARVLNDLDAFKKEYIPARFREEKRSEFMELEQGDMTLAELRQKFDHLAQFAPTLVSTPADRIEEFRKRLRPDVRPYVSTVVTTNFSVAYDLMAKAEKAVDDLKASLGAGGTVACQRPTTSAALSGNRSFGGTKGTQNIKKTKSAPAQSQAASNRSKPSRHPVCNLCGKNHPGSTLSYICVPMPGKSDIQRGDLEYPMVVSNPLGHSMRLHHLYRNCPLTAHGHRLFENLIELQYKEFDIILGMDWLTERQVIIDCGLRTVRLKTDDGDVVEVKGELFPKPPEFMSYMQAKRLIRKKCEAFLCHVRDTRKETPEQKDIPTVCDFPDVFPDDLLGLPTPKEMEFSIDLPTLEGEIRTAQTTDDFCAKTQELVSKGERQDFTIDDKGGLLFRDHLVVPNGEVRERLLREAHETVYTMHPGSNKIYRSDSSHILPEGAVTLDESLTYEEEPVQILAREVKELRNKTVPLVKVLWRNHAVEEAT
ncbi:unnamed protein product [Cuscuta campestris]|uniref:Retrotransposon gag domain-containing protein n=1 Tax=Cuscuta campestris TaxID=132261 RepID=A0A484M7K4_9ASTE|nr:unnamed protein product [Cuscuta campestris]